MVEKVKCFRCWGIEHFKWKYLNIEVKKKRKWNEEVVWAASLQKIQQEERLVHLLWRKVQKYSSAQRMPLRSIVLEQKEQTTRWEVVTNQKNSRLKEQTEEDDNEMENIKDPYNEL